MESIQTAQRIHPLMAGAAASVMLVSLVGVAAITGLIPNSHGEAVAATPAAVAPAPVTAAAIPVSTAAPISEIAPRTVTKVVHHKPAVHTIAYDTSRTAPAQTYAQTAPRYDQPAVQPVQQPVAQHSTVGIATGAVVGGLIGNQMGHGNGRALATVAGALGGGYLGDVVGKKYGY